MRSLRILGAIAAISLIALSVMLPARAPSASAAAGTWTGQYFNNKTVTGTPVLTRDDGATLDFTWAGSAGAGVNPDNFSVRWQKTDTYAASTYRFTVIADDGIRVWVDSTLILDQWIDQAPTTYTVNTAISAGPHTVKV